MSRETVAARLRRIEAQARLFEDRIDDWSPWRVMRNVVDRTASSMHTTIPGRSDFTRGWAALAGAASLLHILVVGRRVDLVVKTARSALREQIGGRFRDVQFDSLLDHAASSLKIEEDNAPAFAARARRAHRAADLDASTFTLFGRVMGRLAPAPLGDFASRAHAALSAEFDRVPTPAELLMRVSTVRWQARLYGLLLRRVRPRAVLVSDTGEYALILACRRLGVPIIELQHGLFDISHPDAVPLEAGPPAQMLVPHAFACRSRYWIGRLVGTHQGEVAVPVGSEAIDRARSMRAARPTGNLYRVVVASQGIDVERIATWLTDAVSCAPTDLDWRMTIKLHPAYDATTTAFNALARHPRVTVVPGADSPSLLDLLAQADIHLSISSAGHFDALALGVPSGVLPFNSWEDVGPALEEGRLTMMESPASLWARMKPVDPDRVAEYSEPDFLKQINALIRATASRVGLDTAPGAPYRAPVYLADETTPG